MNVNVKNKKGICHIGIEGEMTIYSAAQTKEKLLSAMAACNEIELNLAHVSEIDAAGLQLLALAKREAADSNKPLHFVAHSKAILDMLDLCNLAGVFGDPVVISHGQH
jgi:anti-anti-sigma factor